MQLRKGLGVSDQTAWLLLHKLRKAMVDRDQGSKLSGLVEADESYVGDREQGPGRNGRGAESKSVVVVGRRAIRRIQLLGQPPHHGTNHAASADMSLTGNPNHYVQRTCRRGQRA